MKHTWEKLNSKEKDIVLEVLEKYCVPKTVKTIHQAGEFYSGEYEVVIDVEDKGWNFINPKVEEALEGFRSLEKSYELPAYKKEEKKEINRDYSNCRFEDLFKSDIGISELRKGQEELHKKVMELSKLLDEDMKKFEKTTKDSSLVNNYFEKSDVRKQLKDTLKDYLFGEPEQQSIRDLIGKEISKYMGESLINGLVGKSLDYNDSIINQLKGEVIPFDELPLEIKDKLCSEYDEKELKSDNCTIKKIQTQMGYGIAVEFKK